MATIQLRLLKLGARVQECKERITIALPSSCPVARSRPCGLRTIVTDPSRAVCIVYISRSAVLEPYFQPVVQLGWPTPEHTFATQPRISTRTVSQTVCGCG